MTRRPKTPRNTSGLIEALWHWSLDPFRVRYRRQPKGKRRKSGQWFNRYPRPVLWGYAVGRCIDATIAASVRSERARQPALTLEQASMEMSVYGTTTVRASR